MTYFVYVLLCKNNSYYTGITTDINKRFLSHQRGKGAKYTRTHPPIKIVYTKECQDRSEAQKKEYQLKKLSHQAKALLKTID